MTDKQQSAIKESGSKPSLVADNQGLMATNIGKSFKKRPVLRAVTMRVQRGEVVGLLGPNGAGKTTSFYIITGLLSPDSGWVTLDNQDITDLPMYRRSRMGIGYLLNTQPPTWVGKLHPPQSESHFWFGFIRKARPIVIDLRNFVLTSKHRESTMEVRAQRQRLIQNLVDELLQYAAGFWQVPEGWSNQDCGLPEYLQAWLDVGNVDGRKAVQSDKDAWIKAIADSFSECVRKELEYKKITLSDSELKYFRKQIKDESVRMTNELEVML